VGAKESKKKDLSSLIQERLYMRNGMGERGGGGGGGGGWGGGGGGGGGGGWG